MWNVFGGTAQTRVPNGRRSYNKIFRNPRTPKIIRGTSHKGPRVIDAKRRAIKTTYSVTSFKSFNREKSPTNEDRYAIKTFPKFVLFAIFDGHSGPTISNYSSLHFLSYLGRHLIKYGTDHSVFKNAFLEFNKVLHKEFNRKHDGSTVTVVYVDKHKVISANAGDSLAYIVRRISRDSLGKTNKVIVKKITTDHDYNNEKERKRITSAGGKFESGYYTVGNYMLQPTRGFGDFIFKNFKGNTGQDIHTALPTVREYPIGIVNTEFLVLATDGILVGKQNEPQTTMINALIHGRHDHKYLLDSIVKSDGIFGNPLYYPDDVTLIVVDLAMLRKLI